MGLLDFVVRGVRGAACSVPGGDFLLQTLDSGWRVSRDALVLLYSPREAVGKARAVLSALSAKTQEAASEYAAAAPAPEETGSSCSSAKEDPDKRAPSEDRSATSTTREQSDRGRWRRVSSKSSSKASDNSDAEERGPRRKVSKDTYGEVPVRRASFITGGTAGLGLPYFLEGGRLLWRTLLLRFVMATFVVAIYGDFGGMLFCRLWKNENQSFRYSDLWRNQIQWFWSESCLISPSGTQNASLVFLLVCSSGFVPPGSGFQQLAVRLSIYLFAATAALLSAWAFFKGDTFSIDHYPAFLLRILFLYLGVYG